MVDQAEEYREQLLETVATEDDELMEKYLGGEELTEAEIKRAIRKGTLAFDFVPILCGSAFKNKGVQPMLDAVIDYLPSPLDIPPTEGTKPNHEDEILVRQADENEPFAALAFKIVADPFGKLTYFRVYSGQINKGDEVYNSTKEKRERLGRILLMHANQREDLDVAMAGDIVAGLGFKDVTTGDTLCDRTNPIILERMDLPRAGHPRRHRAEDEGRPGQARQGAQVAVRRGPDVPRPHRRGDRPDRHLRHGRAAPRDARRPHACASSTSTPRSASRRSPTARPITKKVESVEYRHIKQTGGSGQFAVVKITLEPNPGGGYEFVDKISGGRIPREYIQPINQGIQAALDSGRARRLPDGRRQGQPRRRPVPRRRLVARWRSRSPARWRFKKAAEMAKPVLLEPIMAVEVVTPEDYMGDVMGDLSSRRGRIEGMEARGNTQVIQAQVPLSEMFGYSTDLRSRTQGRATYTMQFDSYQEVPTAIATDIIKRVRGE